ncbi:MAG: 4-hydroxyphenylacetate 3-hydroxylase [Burkholderiaceae bacterium]|nr:MAG: 4-hydroxyphenylacetate 3-hydroxylase [Burkholderiaceae bacterium]TAM04395.1 MAG: 4-hydroxyphenylacetate 3-hydroxylase [Pusillimonas sp.]
MHKEKSGTNPTPAASGQMRTGAQYLASIKADGRHVYMDGELIKDVTSHPAFVGAANSIASLYDLAADPKNEEIMTFKPANGDARYLRCFQVPKSIDDLKGRHLMSEKWAEATCGLMGRTPDHVAGFLAGYAACPDFFAQPDRAYAKNVLQFHQKAMENSLYIAYAIVPPQIDRSKSAHEQSDPTLYAGVVTERDDGIVIRGAQQLATGAVFADYVYLSCIHPLAPGDENYANGVMVPTNAPGLKIYSRRSFARDIGSTFDYPLSGRFDEIDSLVVFDDVFVPWEDVFIYRNRDLCWNQWWKTPSHSYGNHQAQVRYSTKLKFLLGLTQRLNELTGNAGKPPVQIQMGEMAAMATIVDSMITAQEAKATMDENGVVWPDKASLYAVMALQSQINPKMIDIARELSGGSMIMLPSSYLDYRNPDIAKDLERYISSNGVSSKDRVAILKMAWDMIGTEFAGRHQQYEKFYGGASFLIKQNMYRAYDFKHATALVDHILELPPVEQH